MTAPSPASSGTSLVVQSGDGTKFPSSGSFNATIWPVSTQPTTVNAEIVRVTAISTDTFTITRAQEGTSARTVVVGDQIADTVTAKTLTDVELDVYVTDQDKTIPATTQVIFETYLELSASFFYELSTDAILVIGDFATPLAPPDQHTNIFISVADELVPSNSEVVFSDFYEVSAPFAFEVASGAELQLGTGTPISTAGQLQLVYRYTVIAATKASIDTAVDAPDAGSNDWTNCDLLEIHFSGRVDSAVTNADMDINFNNDTSASYDDNWNRITQVTAANSAQVGNTSLDWQVPGASEVANVFSYAAMTVFNPTGTLSFKEVRGIFGIVSSTAANDQTAAVSDHWRSLNPITQVKVKPHTGGANWVAGTKLLIYKRLAS